MREFHPVSLRLAREHALSIDLLKRSNSATPAVSSAVLNLDGAQLGRMTATTVPSRSNSATPSVVVVPVIW
ncbi:MAG TPA: hypothetical protein VF678_11280 [bacterium]